MRRARAATARALLAGALLGALTGAGAAPPADPVGGGRRTSAAIELLCNLRTGEETRTLRVAPGPDPLAAATATVADRFELRATLIAPAQAAALAQPSPAPTAAQATQAAQAAFPLLAVVSVIDLESGSQPQPLAQGHWAAADQPAILADGAPWAPRLTGWQRSYSPHLGRELAWGCALAAAGAVPQGWATANATLPAELIVPVPNSTASAGLAASSGPAAPAASPTPAEPAAPTTPPTLPQAPPLASTRAPVGPSVRLAWMGDVMLADGPGRVIARGGDPFAGVAALLRQADVRIANLECVIARGGRPLDKPWTFRAHPRTLPVLRRHVDAVSLANNHAGDYGATAFAEMLGRLARAGLPYFGGGADLRAAHRPLIVQRNGLRIALLAYNEMFPRVFEAGPATPGIAWADDEKIAAAIRAARTQADVVIPFMHWGQEHSPAAHARQRALARLMIRAGAHAVVGTHPHVRQDSELIDGRPVIYSLGNFVFDGFSDADNNTGSILWMTVDAQGVADWRLQAVGIDKQGRPYAQAR